jgi:N-acetylglucosamine repressor
MLGVSSAALPASLRRTNQRTVLSLLLRLGSATRADLAKAAGLSQPTAGKIIGELMELGMIQLAGAPGQGTSGRRARESRLGRPGQLVALDDARPRFLGVELGVEETHFALLPVGVKLRDEWSVAFRTANSPAQWVQRLAQECAGKLSAELWGVLVSVPGIVDEAEGKVLFSPNLHWLERTALPALLTRRWGVPVLLIQEIRALALGHLTAEPKCEDFLLVDFGEGVGGAIVLDGRLYSHPMPLSGELGHTPVPGNARLCGCGGKGCLETLVSKGGLLESFKRNGGKRSADWEALVAYAGSHGLEPWLRETLDTTVKIIIGALNVLGLHRVVITGSLAELPEAVTAHLVSEVENGALWARFGEVRCQTAPRRRAAGLVAAGLDRLVLPNYDDHHA